MAEHFVLETENLFAQHGYVLLERLVLGGEVAGTVFEAIDVLFLALPALVCGDAVLLEVRLASRGNLKGKAVGRVCLDHLRLRLWPAPFALGWLRICVVGGALGWGRIGVGGWSLSGGAPFFR